MARDYEKPVEHQTRHDQLEISHPSFALVGASRINGRRRLFGSDFVHNGFISISIRTAVMNRTLSSDWPSGRKELIEIHLSEAQWATFISTLNMGEGIPCTLDYAFGQTIPGIEEAEKKTTDRFHDEFVDTMRDSVRKLNEALKKIDDLPLSAKKKEEVANLIKLSRQEIMSNVKFVVEQFGGHIEDMTEKAKQEIHAYASALVHRAGLKALRDQEGPLQLEDQPRKLERE